MKINSGFTLIELMITVAIIGILSAIAIPMYSDYVTRSRIPQATSQLSARATKMEQFFQDNHTYDGGCIADTVESFGYTCTADANGFTITATGTAGGPMAGFIFTINQNGAKATSGVPTGWTASSGCWITAKGGAC